MQMMLISFNDIPPHEPRLQASSSPIPGIRIWSFGKVVGAWLDVTDLKWIIFAIVKKKTKEKEIFTEVIYTFSTSTCRIRCI